jgi:hypothetical protein
MRLGHVVDHVIVWYVHDINMDHANNKYVTDVTDVGNDGTTSNTPRLSVIIVQRPISTGDETIFCTFIVAPPDAHDVVRYKRCPIAHYHF